MCGSPCDWGTVQEISVFSVMEILDSPRPPPPFGETLKKKYYASPKSGNISFVTPVCPNCERDPCQHGKRIRAEYDEFKAGLGVMFTEGRFYYNCKPGEFNFNV